MCLQWINIDFSLIDQEAGIMVLVGYLVVFLALVMVYFVFRYLVPQILNARLKSLFKKKKAEGGGTYSENEISGEVNAAISMALYMYFNELHDEESNVITIRKVRKPYSPWSSKIYNMRNLTR